MKTMIVRSILWVLPLLVIQTSLNAQTTTPTPPPPATATAAKPAVKKQKFKLTRDRFAIDVDAGGSMPMNTNLSDVFKAGANASLGLKVGLLKNKKLWIRPEGGIKFFSKKADLNSTSMRELYRDWNAGVEIQYRVYDWKKLGFYPFVRADQNWSSNNFSKISDNDAATTTIQTSETFLKGSAPSFSAGLMVVRTGGLYVKVDYTMYKPTLKVHPDLIKDLLAQGILMPESQKFDCSTVNLCIGFNLNFKK
jgi:hypothetical protein